MSISKLMKRALAIVLSAAFVVTSLPVDTYAQAEQIEVGDTQAEEAAPEPSDELPASGNEVSQNDVSQNHVSQNEVKKSAAQEEDDNIADEDAYKGLKVVNPALKRVYEDGTEECISENDVPEKRPLQRSSECQIHIDTSRLTGESGVEVSYSDSPDTQKTIIWNASDSTDVKEVSVPQGACLWVRATKVRADTAVVMRAVNKDQNENYYVQYTGCLYGTQDYVYQFNAWNNLDLFFEEDSDLKTVTYDFEEHECYHIDGIKISRQDGVTVNEGDKVSASDLLNIEYTGEITGVYQLKTYFAAYNAQYISNGRKTVSLWMRKDQNTLHIEAVPQFNVTITVPDEYEEYLEFYTSPECTERLYTGEEQDNQTLESGRGIYAKAIRALPEGKRFYFTFTYYPGAADRRTMDGAVSEEAQFLYDMPASDLKIEVSCVGRKAVTIKNDCSAEVEVYRTKDMATGALSDLVEDGTAELMPGDKLYVKILKDVPAGIYYMAGESSDGQQVNYGYNAWSDGGEHEFELTDIRTSYILIRQESNTPPSASWTVKIENPYGNCVRFYRDENRYYELKNGDTISNGNTSIQVYAELTAAPPKGKKYKVVTYDSAGKQGSVYYLSEEDRSSYFWYGCDYSKIEVIEYNAPKLTLQLDKYADYFSFYTDAEFRNKISEGDYISGSYLYIKGDESSMEPGKVYTLQNSVQYYRSIEISLDHDTDKIYVLNEEKDVSVTFFAERSLTVLSEIVWNGCDSYVSVYKDSTCQEELNAGDYISNSIYLKMTTACADGKAVKAAATRKDTEYNISPAYLGKADDTQSIGFYSNGGQCVLTFEMIDKPVVHINIAEEYRNKIQFYCNESGRESEIKDATAVTPQTSIYARCTLGNENMSIPVHMETMLWNGKEQIPGKTSTAITGGYGNHLKTIGEEDITFDVRSDFYLQIIEQDIESITPAYSYTTDGENYTDLTAADIADGLYVPKGARFRVSATGVTANAEKNALKVGRRWGRGSYIYTDEDSVEITLTDDEPIYISEAPTYEVTVNNQLSDQSRAALIWNEKELVSGMRMAKGDIVSIKVQKVVSGKAVRITANGNLEYYFKDSEENEDSGSYELSIWENTVIGIDEANLRKVTIHQPEGYRVYAWTPLDDWDYGSEAVFEAPEGTIVFLEGGWSDSEKSLKIIRQSTRYPQKEGYLFNEYVKRVEIKDEDLVLDFEPVSAYRLDYNETIDTPAGDGVCWGWDDESEKSFLYVASGSTLVIQKYGINVSEKYSVKVYHTENPAEVVVDNEYLTNKTESYSFVMPAFPVTVDVEREEVKSHTVTINENNFSNGSAVSVKKYNGAEFTEPVKSGDSVYEEQTVRVDADSVAQNRKLLVTFKKTGTNEYATGSPKGMSLEGIKSAIFEMLPFPVTIDVTEKARKGSGKPVYITESLSGGTSVQYNVESGDYLAENEEISIDITQIKAGRRVAVNVICPDENLIASGTDCSKAYYSRIVGEAKKLTFKMPDYPIEIQVWETSQGGEALDISKGEVRFTEDTYRYTGQEIKPEYTAWYDNAIMVEGEDFTVQYIGNVQAGTAQMILTGMGDFKGELRAGFEITRRSLLDEAVGIEMSSKVIYNRKPKYEPLPVVTVNGFALSKDIDYTLNYQGNTAVTDMAEVVITGIGSMEGEVRRTFAIVEETAELKAENIKLEDTSFLYTGEAIEPAVEVYYNHELLDPEVDYSVSYHNNINARDNAYVKVVGIGNYVGAAIGKFEIRQRSFEDSVFQAAVANQKYRKNVLKYEPKPVLVYDGEILTEGADYEITGYVNNECGPEAEKTDAEVFIKGHGNYEGELKLPFSILKNKIDVTKMKLKVQGNKLVYDGNAKTPDIIVTYKGETLDSDDYKLVYQDNVNAGTAKVTVIAIGEYTGSKAASFKIQQKTLKASDYDIADIPAEEYNGANQPVPLVIDKESGTELTGRDLAFSYKNNKKIGKKATVIMKGKGNYKGKLSQIFEIKPMNFNNYDYSVPDCSYTGGRLKPDIIATSRTTGKYFALKSGVAVKVKYENNVNVSGDGSKAKVTFSPKNKNFFEPDNIEPKTIEFSVIPCNLEDATIMPVKVQKYKGKTVKPKLDVRVGTTKLKESRHYKVVTNSERNNSKGIGEVTIVPVSENDRNFTGSQTVTFVIQ